MTNENGFVPSKPVRARGSVGAVVSHKGKHYGYASVTFARHAAEYHECFGFWRRK